ncbi:MAG TPA: hypothetical protein ENK28_00890 [Aliiroseovarius sp.]|nr:hypothetical protein [Aliiroseovarius sp.]
MSIIMFAVLLVLPITHLLLVLTSSTRIFQEEWNQIAKWFLLASVSIINLGGLAMVFGMSKNFTFKVLEPHVDENEPAGTIVKQDDSTTSPEN